MLNFQKAMNKFYIRCEAMGISQKTMTTYRWEFKKFNEYLAMRKIKDVELVTADDIRGYIAYMRSKGYSPVTIQDRWKGLRTFFKYLHTDGLILFNPVAGIPKPKVPKIRARTFTATELQKILGYGNTTIVRKVLNTPASAVPASLFITKSSTISTMRCLVNMKSNIN